MKTFGIILIALGTLALIYTGFSYTKKEKVIDVGPIEINADKQKTVSWPPIAGVILCLAGVAMMVLDKRK